MPPGTYRNISGNLALAYGLVAAAQRSGLPLFLGAYPITPASDILHELSQHKRFGVRTFQAEDEIAGIGAALGASFGGALGVTTTSGPGIALKAETIGLAVSLELPLVVVRHPARRPVDRAADQDRAGRPAAGDVRPQRRGPGADRRAALARRTASTPRSRRCGSPSPTAPRCSCSPTATWPTAPSRGASPTSTRCPTIDPAFATEAERHQGRRQAAVPARTCATPRRWPGRGRSPARPAWSTASAASRRPTGPARSPTTRPTTT